MSLKMSVLWRHQLQRGVYLNKVPAYEQFLSEGFSLEASVRHPETSHIETSLLEIYNMANIFFW